MTCSTKQHMEQTISKSQIQSDYKLLLAEGHEDWEARAILINSFFNGATDSVDYNKIGSPEYFFTIKTIWDLCSI